MLCYQTNSKQNDECFDTAHELGKKITDLDQEYHEMDYTEPQLLKKEEILKLELYDLIEYVKFITQKTQDLRRRVRAAEKIIFDLRKSGETSVENLLDKLCRMKKK